MKGPGAVRPWPFLFVSRSSSGVSPRQLVEASGIQVDAPTNANERRSQSFFVGGALKPSQLVGSFHGYPRGLRLSGLRQGNELRCHAVTSGAAMWRLVEGSVPKWRRAVSAKPWSARFNLDFLLLRIPADQQCSRAVVTEPDDRAYLLSQLIEGRRSCQRPRQLASHGMRLPLDLFAMG